jgi:hypothetical protein
VPLDLALAFGDLFDTHAALDEISRAGGDAGDHAPALAKLAGLPSSR